MTGLPPTPLAGRVYLHPEPLDGPHPGFRGPLRVDVLGVHLDADCEFLLIHDQDSKWEPVERDLLIPWHRVDSIEWSTDETH